MIALIWTRGGSQVVRPDLVVHPGFHWQKMLIGWCIATLLAVILVLSGHLRFHLFSSSWPKKFESLKGVGAVMKLKSKKFWKMMEAR